MTDVLIAPIMNLGGQAGINMSITLRQAGSDSFDGGRYSNHVGRRILDAGTFIDLSNFQVVEQ